MDMPRVGMISGARSSLTVGGGASISSSQQTSRNKRRKLREFSAGSSIVQHDSTIPITSRPTTTILSPSPAKESEAGCNSLHTEELPNSCCSSNGSTEQDDESVGFSLDLEVESAEAETSTCNCSGNQRKNMSELRNETNKSEEIMESSAAEKPKEEKKFITEVNSHCNSSAKKRPSEMELEEFFGAAEKEIQKKFATKYNYDIVNDVPLEGRYEWVKLKP